MDKDVEDSRENMKTEEYNPIRLRFCIEIRGILSENMQRGAAAQACCHP